ncbi:MAG: biopolymer transporter ExbD [Candidatus Competibacteraceae bacterium]|jgi:biopolymer transport protein ExbD|nr:biopolymer transporter ExbD [Candidatus Competibacteraceae bacterium]
MNLRPRRRQEPDINLTPLIDVVFLLLIFFMVSTTFRKETELSINLPEADQAPTVTEEDRGKLEIGIDEQGQYFINGKALSDTRRETLQAALMEAVGDDPELPLVISADAETPHQAVVTAMDVAGKIGIKQLAITVQQYQAESATDQ